MKLIVDSWQCFKLMQYSINQVNSTIVLSGCLLWSIVILEYSNCFEFSPIRLSISVSTICSRRSGLHSLTITVVLLAI